MHLKRLVIEACLIVSVRAYSPTARWALNLPPGHSQKALGQRWVIDLSVLRIACLDQGPDSFSVLHESSMELASSCVNIYSNRSLRNTNLLPFLFALY